MKNARERMDVIAAYRDVGTYRGAAAVCGTTHKTVKRIIEAHELVDRGVVPARRGPRGRNFDEVADLVAQKVDKAAGRISAKRLLPAARAAGYAGSDRNFRRLVADAKRVWRAGQARAGGRRPAVWTPGEVLAIDWGTEVLAGRRVHVFCAVLAWSRFRFVVGLGRDSPWQPRHPVGYYTSIIEDPGPNETGADRVRGRGGWIDDMALAPCGLAHVGLRCGIVGRARPVRRRDRSSAAARDHGRHDRVDARPVYVRAGRGDGVPGDCRVRGPGRAR